MSAFSFRNIIKLKGWLFDYSYLQDIGKTYNRNFLLTRNLTGSRWVGKISKSLLEKGVDFRDLNSRAMLAYRLAALVGHKVLAPKVIPVKRISGLDPADIPDKIDDKVFLTAFDGVAIPEFLNSGQLRDLKNLEEIFDNLVFNIWIGNHDRKDGDYIVDRDKTVYFIDYHLCGPGFKSDYLLSLGAYAESYSINDPADIGWCIGSPVLLKFMRDESVSFDKFLPMIKRIEGVRDAKISQAMRKLKFYDEHNEDNINGLFLDFLLRRRHLLRSAVKSWIEAGYPKGPRPKDPGRQDNIYSGIL
ncbi:hypothetical protein HYW17_03980 [Candidatus Uhrbacteria bacterium]|nr:hypothetical protein [Candidatus Uhrbacteria bacterium]